MTEHEHVQRVLLPWRSREDALTECGLPADPRTTLSVEEMRAKIARQGQQRAALSSCMTCWSTVNRHYKERSGDILSTIHREVGRDYAEVIPFKKKRADGAAR